MKRKEDPTQKVCVRCLAELDALVGKYLTGESPRVQWVNTHTDFRFDSVEEAVEAVNDPFFCHHATPSDPSALVLMEVHEFRRYSSDLTLAWELVEHLTHRLEPLLVRREGNHWEGAFGNREFISAQTAPVAICLAALRTRGVEVECRLDAPDARPAVGMTGATIKSLYSR